MPKTQVTTSIESPKPSILDRSGLDVVLENIDKHLQSIDQKLNDTPTRERVDTLDRELRDAQHELDDKIEALRKDKVSNESFKPVRILVYGFTGIILVAVVTAMVALVVK